MNKVKFEKFNLSGDLVKAIQDIGYEEATPIQAQAIPVILEGRDVIGQSQTGTGKTAAFGLPLLELIDGEKRELQALVLCPTRELAIQVTEELQKLGKYKKASSLAIYGGQSIDRQIKALKRGVNIVVGTPGRVMDHMRRNTLNINSAKMIVLDEADEMLNMGFREDIETILNETSENRQTILFSATMPKPILNLTKQYQKDPELIKVVNKELTVKNIDQIYFEVKEKDKIEILTRVVDIYNPKLSLVFCNTKKRVDEVVMELQTRKYSADGLHGDLKQSQRDIVMNKFRNGAVQILVATDVAARGLDVDDVEIVFNYDVPQNEENYVHRIGRTGRAGREGLAFTFVAGKGVRKLKDIERYTKTKVVRQSIPTVKDVEEVKTNNFLDEVKNVLDNENLKKEIKIIEKQLEDYSTAHVAAALLKVALTKDETKREIDSKVEPTFKNTGAEAGMVRLFINIGKKHKVNPGDIIGAIAGETGIPGRVIGAIDIFEKFSFVEVPEEHANNVISVMKNNKIKGTRINVEPANSR